MNEKELIDKTEKIIEGYKLNTADDKSAFNIFTILRDEDEEVMMHQEKILTLKILRKLHRALQQY